MDNILYLFLGGGISSEVSSWTLQGVDMNTFETTNDIITCEKITTGTYVEETTITCTPEIPKQEFDQTPRVDFEFLQKDGSTPVSTCRPDSAGRGPYPNHPYHAEFYDDELIFVWYRACSGGGMDHFGSQRTVGVFDYNGKHLSFLSSPYKNVYKEAFSKTSVAVSSSTDKKYIYFVTQEGGYGGDRDAALYSKVVDHGIRNLHHINTDLRSDEISIWSSHVFHNEESNKVYYFVKSMGQGNILYVINGMGTKLTAEEAAVAAEAVAAEAVAAEAVAAEAAPTPPTPELSTGCGEGTVLVDGVCLLAETSVTEDDMVTNTGYVVLALFILLGIPIIIIGVIVILIRGRKKTPKLTKQERDDYEDVKEIKRKIKDGLKTPKPVKPKPVKKEPAKKKETSAFCENCGNTLNPKAKFCGSCGTPVS